MAITDTIQVVIDEINFARKCVDDLQKLCGYPTLGDRPPDITSHTLWNRLETIDDRLHEALTKLGD